MQIRFSHILKFSVLCAFFGWHTVSVFGQDIRRYPLTLRSYDDQFSKTQGIAPCFVLRGNTVEEFRNFATDNKTPLKKQEIILPEMNGALDTAYGYLFFGGTTNAFAPGYTLFVVADNRVSITPAYIWVDRNNNLNLSDDGSPDTCYYYTPYFDVELPSLSLNGAKHIARLSRFPINENNRYKMLLDTFMVRNSGNKVFSGADYSFREQRLNLMAADLRIGTDSFRIAIKDRNCNGIFNESEMDQVLIGPVGTVVNRLNAVSLDKKKNYFEWNQKQYIIHKIDPAGTYIEFKEQHKARLKRSLREGKRIPRFRFKPASLSKDTSMVSVRKLKHKPSYIYFFNRKAPGFGNDTAVLNRLFAQYGSAMNILVLSYGDHPWYVNHYNETNGVRWNMGFSSLSINRKMRVESLPRGYYTGKRLRLKKAGMTPSEMLHLLETSR